MYEITRMPANIEIGYTGEKGFRTIEIDMTPWMEILPNGVPSIVHIRPGETEADAYIAATTFEDNILRWTISAGDLGETEGTGLAQIWLEESENDLVNKRGKSVLVATIIRQALNDASETPPEAQEAWLEQMTALKVATVNAAGDAEDSAEDSEAWAVGKRGGVDVETTDPAYHNNSKYHSQQASGSATDAGNAKTAAEAAKDAAIAATAHYPYVDITTGNWMVWDTSTGAFVNTGVHAQGPQGDEGPAAYVYIRYAANQPTQDSDMKTTPDEWMGMYSGDASTAPTSYTSYTWYKIKGEKGSSGVEYASELAMSPLDSTKADVAINGKVPIQQDIQDAGKALGIGNDGRVTPVPFSGDDFTGATASTNGVHGYVPAPLAGEQGYVLMGDGDWDIAPGARIYVATTTVTNVSGAYSNTVQDENLTEDLVAMRIERGDSSVFHDKVTITPGSGSYTISCPSVAGTSTLKIFFAKQQQNPLTITSTEFDILNNRLQAVENVYTDSDVTIASTDWTLSDGVYAATWTSSLVTTDCGIEVFLRDGAEGAEIEDFDYGKVIGGVQFTTDEQPTGNLPVTIRIINAKSDQLVDLSADQISSEAITGCDDVEEALGDLDGRVTTLNSNLANFCKPVYNSFTAQATHDISCPVAGKYLVIARANSSTLSNTAILAITSSGKPTARAIGAAGGNCVCTWCDDVAQNAIISLSSSNMSTDDGYFHVFAILLQPA